MSEKDKKLVNEWDIIDTFFRDTDYYKSQHQIDSFDEFIFSEQNGIKNIIKGENPFIIKKGENSKGNFDYEIYIYCDDTSGSPIILGGTAPIDSSFTAMKIIGA